MSEAINIYDPRYISKLFAEMAATYGIMNLVTSFGFTARWRRFCVNELPEHSVVSCCDLMSGMGELIPDIQRQFPEIESITALDICPVMCRKISENCARFNLALDIREEDVFKSSLADQHFDCVVSSFGLKTFSPTQLRSLAGVVSRILKPGGVFAFIEISLPKYVLLRVPLLLYLRYIVPLIGRLLLGNPENYRMLSIYTERFRDARHFESCLIEEGLETQYISNFFGCSTGVVGRKVV